jgi:hypothetical protein
VRDIFLNSRYPPQHAGSCIIQGIVQKESVSEIFKSLPANALQGVAFDKTTNSLEPAKSVSWVGENVKCGVTSLGNGSLLWNVIASQQKPEQHVFNMLAARYGAQPAHQSDTWMIPVSDSSPTSTEPRVVSSEEAQTLEAQQDQIQETEELTPEEIAQLASSLLTKETGLPSTLGKLVNASDLESLIIKDNVDLAEEPPKSYITPNFHPGRIILIGDAAHPCALGPHGSVAASLAIADAVFLAKLFVHTFSEARSKEILAAVPQESKNSSNEDILLKHLALTYDGMRRHVCEARMLQARQEATWKRQEPGILRSIFQFGAPYSWTKQSFEQWISEGEVVEIPTL